MNEEAQAEGLRAVVDENPATKQDLKELEGAMRHDLRELKSRLRQELKSMELRLTLRLGGIIVAGVAILAVLIQVF